MEPYYGYIELYIVKNSCIEATIVSNLHIMLAKPTPHDRHT